MNHFCIEGVERSAPLCNFATKVPTHSNRLLLQRGKSQVFYIVKEHNELIVRDYNQKIIVHNRFTNDELDFCGRLCHLSLTTMINMSNDYL